MNQGDDREPDALHWWTARQLAAALRNRELSAREVMGWHLERIERSTRG